MSQAISSLFHIPTMKGLKSIGSTITFFIFAVFVLIIPRPVAAQQFNWEGACVGGPEGTAAADVATIQGLECLLANVFNVFLTVLGLIGFVMFVAGSIRWMISGGSSKHLETARGAMTYAIVGIVLALSAFIILRLIADFTGIQTITEFRIPRSTDGF